MKASEPGPMANRDSENRRLPVFCAYERTLLTPRATRVLGNRSMSMRTRVRPRVEAEVHYGLVVMGVGGERASLSHEATTG
eukprot:scaffold61621_cov31-Tisochrysis_lutea.AAC.2